MRTYYLSPRYRWNRAERPAEAARPDVYVPVDVVVENDEFILTAYVPGVDAEAIDIEILEDTLKISGEFMAPEGEDLKYLLRERPHGRFERSLRLPDPMDAAKAEAEVSNGVLTVRVPKAEYAKAKQIAVKAK